MPLHPAGAAGVLGCRHRGVGHHAELAIPLLEEAAGGRVEGLIGGEDPFQAISAALGARRYDEIIVSTLPAHVSHWLHVDLPARIRRLGLPVTVVTARKAGRPIGPAG